MKRWGNGKYPPDFCFFFSPSFSFFRFYPNAHRVILQTWYVCLWVLNNRHVISCQKLHNLWYWTYSGYFERVYKKNYKHIGNIYFFGLFYTFLHLSMFCFFFFLSYFFCFCSDTPSRWWNVSLILRVSHFFFHAFILRIFYFVSCFTFAPISNSKGKR